MNFEPTSSLLRDTVKGADAIGPSGAKARVKGLLEIVQLHVVAVDDREQALTQLGLILGVASMLGGLKDRGPA